MNKLSSLRKRLRKASGVLSHNMFDEYDFNQDNMIGRDEWEGSNEAFSLLDLDQDEYLDQDEVSVGLGQAFSRQADSEGDRILSPQEIADLLGGKLLSVKTARRY